MAADPKTVVSYIAGGVGLAAMLVLAPFYLASGLVAPLWAVALLMVIWALLTGLGVVLMIRRRPWWALPLPLLAVGIWLATVTLGEKFLGWTA